MTTYTVSFTVRGLYGLKQSALGLTNSPEFAKGDMPKNIKDVNRCSSAGLFRLLAILLLCVPVILLSNTDSLVTLINNSHGSDRINARLDYADAIAKTEIVNAIQNAKLALDESLEINAPLLIAKAQFRVAQLFIGSNNNDSAEVYLKLALPIVRDHHEADLSSRIQVELGKIYQYRGDDLQAMELFNEAIEAAETIENYRLIGTSYSLIGNIYRVLGAYDEALESIIKAKSNYQLAEFEEGRAWISYSLGRLYRGLGIYEEAEASFNESLIMYNSLAEVGGDSTGIALCLDQLGLLYIAKKMPHMAIPFFRRSLDIYTGNNSFYGISNAWKNLGKAEFAQGNYSEARSLLNNSLNYKYRDKDALGIPGIYDFLGLVLIAEDHWQAGLDTLAIGLSMAKANNQHQVLYDIYGHLAEAYEDKDYFLQAIKYYKLQFSLQGFIGPNAVRFKFPELRGIYEMEQSRKKIKNLQQNNRIIELQLTQQRLIKWGLITGGIILAIFLGFLYKQYHRIRVTNIENENLVVKLQEEIVQREQVGKALAESNSLRELLLDIITHDLKNPAGVIYGLSEMARTELPDNELIGNIFLSSERLLAVLADTTILSQATFGEDIPKQEIVLSQIMQEVVEDFSSALATAEIKVEMDIPKNIVINANPLVGEVFKNYVSNAIKYAAEGNRILIEAKLIDEMVTVSVKDFGETLAIENRQNIFERQTQLPGAKKSGRGLGLAIVKRIATAHNGEVWVEPNIPAGNSFCLRIPLNTTSILSNTRNT